MDSKITALEKKGKLVPTRDMIKTSEQIEGIRKSGIVNIGCLDAVAEITHAGMNTQEIDDIYIQYCKDYNAIPACLSCEGHLKGVCTSINEVVYHGVPRREDVLQEGDIINVDMITIVDGYYADANHIFITGKMTPEKERSVRAAKECLEIGAEVAKPYSFVGDIGHVIQKHAEKNGYGVVRDLCGYGVGTESREQPDIVHYEHKGTGMLLAPGMVFTIEPMIDTGTWKVFIDTDDPYGWGVITGDEKPPVWREHIFVVTEHGLEILAH